MAKFPMSEFEKVPFIDTNAVSGRFFTTLMFFDDGKWRTWISTENGLLEIQAFPAESMYFAKAPQEISDIHIEFMDFIAQRSSFPEVIKPYHGLQDDIFNLSAVVAKLKYLEAARGDIGHGVNRMVVTEIEYLFSICRSVFDLLHEINVYIWNSVDFFGQRETKKLPAKLSKVLEYDGKYSNAFEMIARFGMPEPWAAWYERHINFFSTLREFRDNIVHRGSAVSSVFVGEDGFSVSQKAKPFDKMAIWDSAEVSINEVVPLWPAVDHIIWSTLLACEDCSRMLKGCIAFPPELVPGMHLYMRGSFTGDLLKSLCRAEQRAMRRDNP